MMYFFPMVFPCLQDDGHRAVEPEIRRVRFGMRTWLRDDLAVSCDRIRPESTGIPAWADVLLTKLCTLAMQRQSCPCNASCSIMKIIWLSPESMSIKIRKPRVIKWDLVFSMRNRGKIPVFLEAGGKMVYPLPMNTLDKIPDGRRESGIACRFLA